MNVYDEGEKEEGRRWRNVRKNLMLVMH